MLQLLWPTNLKVPEKIRKNLDSGIPEKSFGKIRIRNSGKNSDSEIPEKNPDSGIPEKSGFRNSGKKSFGKIRIPKFRKKSGFRNSGKIRISEFRKKVPGKNPDSGKKFWKKIRIPEFRKKVLVKSGSGIPEKIRIPEHF